MNATTTTLHNICEITAHKKERAAHGTLCARERESEWAKWNEKKELGTDETTWKYRRKKNPFSSEHMHPRIHTHRYQLFYSMAKLFSIASKSIEYTLKFWPSSCPMQLHCVHRDKVHTVHGIRGRVLFSFEKHCSTKEKQQKNPPRQSLIIECELLNF